MPLLWSEPQSTLCLKCLSRQFGFLFQHPNANAFEDASTDSFVADQYSPCTTYFVFCVPHCCHSLALRSKASVHHAARHSGIFSYVSRQMTRRPVTMQDTLTCLMFDVVGKTHMNQLFYDVCPFSRATMRAAAYELRNLAPSHSMNARSLLPIIITRQLVFALLAP